MSAENLPLTTLCYNKTYARTGLKHIYNWTLGSFCLVVAKHDPIFPPSRLRHLHL